MTKDTIYLDTNEAARFLGLSSKTLSRYRVSGDGPVFHRFDARIRYRRASTSDDGTALSGAAR